MKRILINATHNEEIRVALCKDNHLYDFDLENRTREQKKSNIYKGHVTRVEPSLEAVFVEYGSERQGFLPIREIASEYLKGNPREENIRKLIKEGDELIIQIEKEERGNKGAALSTFISLAGRYLVLMPNNPRGGGISRQITGRLREEMKRMLSNMDLPKGMSVIVRTAGIGKTQEDLQHDLNHLLNIWSAIQEQNKKYPSPRLVHQEAGVVTRAVRDYLRDDISEIWIDSENAYNEAESFIKAVMPKQIGKLRKYTDYEPMFANFNVEKQIETAYQREVRLPSGGSIVIDQTEALVSIDINSAKSTKGSDVSETAYHTNLEAAEEIARQLRLRDMGGLVVIDFIDMSDSKHQRDVEKRLVDSTKYDRARVQFGTISKFGLMEMSRQRLRPSLEESTGYICPRCHGNGMIRDLRSLSLAIMREIEEIALKRRHGEVQAEVPTDIAAFLLNEKRESLVYLEQDSGTRITILPHAHMESPHFKLHFNQDGFVPASYERISDTQDLETSERGYEVDWQTNDAERPEQQPTRQPVANNNKSESKAADKSTPPSTPAVPAQAVTQPVTQSTAAPAQPNSTAVAWLANLFAPTSQARTVDSISSQDAANAIEDIVNAGGQSRGVFGDVAATLATLPSDTASSQAPATHQSTDTDKSETLDDTEDKPKRRSNYRNKNDRSGDRNRDDKHKRKGRNGKPSSRNRTHDKHQDDNTANISQTSDNKSNGNDNDKNLSKRRPHSKRDSRGNIERGEALTHPNQADKFDKSQNDKSSRSNHSDKNAGQNDSKDVTLHVKEAPNNAKEREVIHFSLDDTNSKDENLEAANAKSANNDNVKYTDVQSNVDKTSKSDTTASKNADKTAKPAKDVITQDQPAKTSDTSSSEDGASNTKASDTATHKHVIEDESGDNTEYKTLSLDTDELFAKRYVTANKYGQASNDPRVVRAQQTSKSHQSLEATAKTDNSENKVLDKPVTDTKNPLISGTVGEFVNSTLDADDVQEGNIIANFLKALSKFEAQKDSHNTVESVAKTADTAKHAKNSNANLQTFTFSNYGYAPLSASYLDNFHDMTSAVDAFSTEQGKIDPIEPAVTKRASNDPRGQHPDYQEPTNQADNNLESENLEVDNKFEEIGDNEISDSEIGDSEIGDSDSEDVTDKSTDSKQQDSSSDTLDVEVTVEHAIEEDAPFDDYKAFSELMAGSVGNFVEKILGATGRELIDQGNTETAFLTALKQPMTEILERLKAAYDVTEHAVSKHDNLEVSQVSQVSQISQVSQVSTDETAHALIPDEVLDEVIAETASQNINDNTESVESSDEDHSRADQEHDKATSNKTSIASYKSMIENISEQLSSQMGLSTLIPIPTKSSANKYSSSKDQTKPRTRKTKSNESTSDKED